MTMLNCAHPARSGFWCGLAKGSDRLDWLVLRIAALLILAMLGLSLTGIGYQLLFDQALSWSTSLARLLLPWIAMLSITVAFKHGEHIALTLAIDLVPRRVLQAVLLVNLLMVALFAGLLVWYGAEFFEFSTQSFMVSDRLQLSHRWTAASMPVAGAILCVHLSSGLALVRQVDLLEEV